MMRTAISRLSIFRLIGLIKFATLVFLPLLHGQFGYIELDCRHFIYQFLLYLQFCLATKFFLLDLCMDC